MYIFEILNSALQNIKANKLRSFLTMLGIIIGISSVITIASIGGAIKEYVTGEFAGMGTNVINLQVDTTESIGKRDYFTLEDAELIKEKVPEVTAVVPMAEGFGTVELQDKTKMASVAALNQHYVEIYDMDLAAGRFINEHDVETKKYVAVIDELTADKFFSNSDAAIGQRFKVNINGNYSDMTVIGVMKSQGILASFGENVPAQVYIPITIYDQVLGNENISHVSVLVSDMTKADEISSKIIRIIENKHNNTDKYTASQGFAALDMVNNVLDMLTAALSAIAAISLVVGGIGVMNIMLVSVTERTREIGIRKAVGAKTNDIRIQFLSESVILCLIGGGIGIIFGFLICKIIGYTMDVSVPVSIATVAIAFIFSSAVGIFFGLYPASKAAKMDPIEALRHE
ncbi:MAG: putative transporter, permease component [Firmicutes bacterium]|nr:putative transporter, permease component [Bacillota bacterium]